MLAGLWSSWLVCELARSFLVAFLKQHLVLILRHPAGTHPPYSCRLFMPFVERLGLCQSENKSLAMNLALPRMLKKMEFEEHAQEEGLRTFIGLAGQLRNASSPGHEAPIGFLWRDTRGPKTVQPSESWFIPVKTVSFDSDSLTSWSNTWSAVGVWFEHTRSRWAQGSCSWRGNWSLAGRLLHDGQELEDSDAASCTCLYSLSYVFNNSCVEGQKPFGAICGYRSFPSRSWAANKVTSWVPAWE